MDNLKQNINKYITNHKCQWLNHQYVVCLDCLSEYDKMQIKDWCDDGQTAICPYCWNDAVLLSPQHTNLYTYHDIVTFRGQYFGQDRITTHAQVTFVNDETFSFEKNDYI